MFLKTFSKLNFYFSFQQSVRNVGSNPVRSNPSSVLLSLVLSLVLFSSSSGQAQRHKSIWHCMLRFAASQVARVCLFTFASEPMLSSLPRGLSDYVFCLQPSSRNLAMPLKAKTRGEIIADDEFPSVAAGVKDFTTLVTKFCRAHIYLPCTDDEREISSWHISPLHRQE